MIKVKTKVCKTCKTEKEFSEFYKKAKHPSRGIRVEGTTSEYDSQCKVCFKARMQHKRDTIPGYRKNVDLKHNFGITLDDYNEMLKKQNYRCEVCLRHESEFSRKLSVDHNHSTGKIRGLLCSQCNTALGKLREDEETINRLLKYIEKYKV